MKSNTIALTRPENPGSAYRWIDQFAKKIFLSKFSEIRHGRIKLTLDFGAKPLKAHE